MKQFDQLFRELQEKFNHFFKIITFGNFKNSAKKLSHHKNKDVKIAVLHIVLQKRIGENEHFAYKSDMVIKKSHSEMFLHFLTLFHHK